MFCPAISAQRHRQITATSTSPSPPRINFSDVRGGVFCLEQGEFALPSNLGDSIFIDSHSDSSSLSNQLFPSPHCSVTLTLSTEVNSLTTTNNLQCAPNQAQTARMASPTALPTVLTPTRSPDRCPTRPLATTYQIPVVSRLLRARSVKANNLPRPFSILVSPVTKNCANLC